MNRRWREFCDINLRSTTRVFLSPVASSSPALLKENIRDKGVTQRIQGMGNDNMSSAFIVINLFWFSLKTNE